MKNSTKILLAVMGIVEALLAVILFNALNTSFPVRLLVVGAVVVLSLIADGAILHAGSASVVSDAKKLKDADDYIKAFNAWLNEDTPFENYIKIAIKQLESLKRKQKALRAVLDDSWDSPFLRTAEEVNQYVLANSKRVLSRVMIYDQNDPAKYNMHASYLENVLGENARMLSDFENLIVEVSQIGDDVNAASTPMLNELTKALRSVRISDEEWDQQEQHFDPPQQMMMQ